MAVPIPILDKIGTIKLTDTSNLKRNLQGGLETYCQ